MKVGDTDLPKYQTPFSAGLDLKSIENIIIQPMERKLIKTGLKVSIPHGFEGQIRPRSGLALRQGITLVNSPGTIDSDYRGEIGIILINLGNEEVAISRGERVAQLVICPIVRAELEEVQSLDDTERSSGGFGSTGTS